MALFPVPANRTGQDSFRMAENPFGGFIQGCAFQGKNANVASYIRDARERTRRYDG
jgi:hypothetical protein